MPPVSAKPIVRSPIWRFAQAWLRVLFVGMFRLKVYGAEHIPATGGVLLASNHQSFLDPVLIAVMLKRPVSFLASQYLFDVRGFGWLIRQLHAFPVQQGKGDRAAVAMCIEKLREGHVLGVFPEGHRTPDGQLKHLQGGTALIVRKAGVPIIPVVVDGSYDAWPRQRKTFRPHPIHVLYGEPLDVSGLQGSQIMEALRVRLEKLLVELKNRRQESGWGR